MTYKKGVPDDTLANDMWQLLNVIDVVTLYTTKRYAIVTSTTDGNHKKGSLHYKGLAVDLRINDLTPVVTDAYYSALKLALSRLCDVIREKDHIHVEYQPKYYKL